MERDKPLFGAETSARPQADLPRDYRLRVRRDHGGGLWTFEGDDGQLYLAVKSNEASEVLRAASDSAAADGRAYETSAATRARRLRRVSRAA